MFRGKSLFRIVLITLITLCIMNIHLTSVLSATNQFKGVNWACQGDNYQSGNLYISGLSSSDTYSSAATVADRVVGQFVSKLGANSVRMPINETSVNGNYWNVYTGAIDKALTYGKVILCYWSWTRGVPTSMTDWWNMWSKVINKYGSNSNCYFEPFNEPNMYSNTDLCNLYNEFVNIRFTSVPKGRFILDGAGLAQNVPAVGGDSRLSGCLLAVHDYSFFAYLTSESAWQNHIKSYVGNYADRTVCTEWGYPNSPGSKNGVNYGYIDYLASSGTGGGDYFYYYARGISKQLRSWSMGSFYWPGLRDGDWYSMTTKTGSGSSINLSIPNSSGLYWLQYAWGSTGPTPTPISGPRSAFSQTEAESYDTQSGIQTESCGEGGQNIGYIENGDYVVYNSIDFGSGASGFQARVSSATSGGNIEIRLDSTTGTLIGTCSVTGTGGWQNWVTNTYNVSGVSGVHDLYLRFTGGSGYLLNMNWFKFTGGSVSPAPTVTPLPTVTTTSTPIATPTPTATLAPTPTPAGSYVRFQNAATSLFIDGMGSTANGSNACQYSSSGSNNQQWKIIVSGSYVMIQNRATGLYLDGMGRTSNGSICCQWAYSGSNNQQWTQETMGSYVRFKNRATGLYLDGMGSASNGSNLCQYSGNSSTNQQWQIQ